MGRFLLDSLFHEGLVFLPVIRIKHLHPGSSTEAVVFHAQWFRPLLSVFEKSQGRNDGTATWRMNGLRIWLPSSCFEGVILWTGIIFWGVWQGVFLGDTCCKQQELWFGKKYIIPLAFEGLVILGISLTFLMHWDIVKPNDGLDAKLMVEVGCSVWNVTST